MAAPLSKLQTDRVVDEPVVIVADYRMTDAERRFIDNQIRACEQALVDLVLPGWTGSYFTLDGGSAALVAGDLFSASATGTVAQATGALTITGISPYAVAPGGVFRGVTSGVLSPTLTGLPIANGFARLSSVGRCENVVVLSSGDVPLGWSTNGWLVFHPGQKIAQLAITPTLVGDTNYNALSTDYVIEMGTRTAARTVFLPATPDAIGETFVVMDVSGQGSTWNITVSGNGNNINGAATNVINTDYGKGSYYWTGSTYKWFKAG